MRRGTVSGRGQVVIPADIREALHIESGTKVSFEVREGVLQIVPITEAFLDQCMGKYPSSKDARKEFAEERAKDDAVLEAKLKKVGRGRK
jgi:AbrB family looped-hinge helix DNA binding protein